MPDPIQIFIAYSRKDSSLLDEMRNHLTPLSRSGRVKVWYDGELDPGSVWEDGIKNNLHSSEIILLLVSASAIASDYFYEKEMRDALGRHAQGTAHVVPLILRPCDWSATPLVKLQAIPKNGQAVTSWTDRDDAFADAVISIRKLVEKIEQERAVQAKAKEAAPAPKKAVPVAKPIPPKPKELEPNRPASLNDNIAGDMILVKGGTFQMGEKGIAEPVHPVTLSDYYIGKYPVTQKQWREVMGSHPPELFNKGCDDCPVERVSWDDVQEFLQKLNKKTGQNYRLPTEAEWEYAARGGAKSKGFKYAGSDNLDEVGWYKENSELKIWPIGQKNPNELGIYDMTGNVWEWCEDWVGSYTSNPQTNPKGPSEGVIRVFRGGSWFISPENCRVADRGVGGPTDRYGGVGFRLVLQL